MSGFEEIESKQVSLLDIGSRTTDSLLDIGSRTSNSNLLDIGSRTTDSNNMLDIGSRTTDSNNMLDIGSRTTDTNDMLDIGSRTSETNLLDIGSHITHDNTNNINAVHELIVENISDQKNLVETTDLLLGIGSRLSQDSLDNLNNDTKDTNVFKKEEVVLSQRSQEFMSLSQITASLNEILKAANNGENYDEKRLNELIQAQKENPEYQAQLEEERRRWRSTVDDFLIHSLLKMRTFVPPNIHSANLESLAEAGLSSDIAKRLLNKKCLWLVRMSSDEISRLHEADLFNKYNTSGQVLDIVETAAIYSSLPEHYLNDHSGKKQEWATLLEQNLKQMLMDQEKGRLPKGKQRSAVYTEDMGPITDLDTLKDFEFVTNKGQRKSFQEVCKRYSIFNCYKENENNDDTRHKN